MFGGVQEGWVLQCWQWLQLTERIQRSHPQVPRPRRMLFGMVMLKQEPLTGHHWPTTDSQVLLSRDTIPGHSKAVLAPRPVHTGICILVHPCGLVFLTRFSLPNRFQWEPNLHCSLITSSISWVHEGIQISKIFFSWIFLMVSWIETCAVASFIQRMYNTAK